MHPDRLMAHLRAAGAIGEPVDLAGTTPLPGGAPEMRLGRDGELSLRGLRVTTDERRLGDLVRLGEGRQRRFLVDRPAAERAAGDGGDREMYRARRDVFPPRTDGPVPVLADLVVYQEGVLPGGEPHRSLGHWNPAGQVEVFEVLTGRVALLVVGRSAGEPYAHLQRCGPGDLAAVPLGAWHVTYVLDGPAAVFNIYADAAAPAPGQDPHKYERGAPVDVTLRRDGADLHPVYGDGARASWGPVVESTGTAGLDDRRRRSGGLVGLHLDGSRADWDELLAAAGRPS